MFGCTMVGLKNLGIVGDFATLSKTKATSDLCGMAVLIGYKNSRLVIECMQIVQDGIIIGVVISCDV
jgi:hypothetical protein